MTPGSYCMVIGHAWYPAGAWRRANSSRPFVGLRLDPESRDVWVLCELVVDGKQLPVAAQEAVERAMEPPETGRGVVAGIGYPAAPAHCTGLNTITAVHRAMPKKLIMPSTGRARSSGA